MVIRNPVGFIHPLSFWPIFRVGCWPVTDFDTTDSSFYLVIRIAVGRSGATPGPSLEKFKNAILFFFDRC